MTRDATGQEIVASTTDRIAPDGSIGDLVLGCNTFGWTVSPEDTDGVLDAFLDRGGRMVDTADSYSFWAPGNRGGESEELLGSWMSRRGVRDRILVATKVSQHPEFRGLSRENVRRGLDASLRRLKVDTIDLYYAHFDDPAVPLEETVAAFEDARLGGKIRAVGLSNFTPERVCAWFETCDELGAARPSVLQPHYNLVERTAEEELLPLARQLGMLVVPYYALAQGLLTGKYRTGSHAGQRAARVESLLTPENLATVERVAEVATSHSVPLTRVALAWLAGQPTVTAPIASVTRVEQLDDLMEYSRLRLTDEELHYLGNTSEV